MRRLGLWIAVVGALGSWPGRSDSPPESICTIASADRITTTSIECLSCHDGTVTESIAESHPFDVDYDAARTRSSDLRPRGALPANLVLPGGKVTCLTCHDGASTEPAKTSLPQAGSQLCFACHAL